jgi:predicted nuclease of predicted toxin-antitoxin system
MSIRFYFDEHMPRRVAESLIQSGIEVVLAVDVGMTQKDDDTEHLQYAAENDLVMVTFDRPFAGRTVERMDHTGLICLSEHLRNDIGGQIRTLANFATSHPTESVVGQVFWLK